MSNSILSLGCPCLGVLGQGHLCSRLPSAPTLVLRCPHAHHWIHTRLAHRLVLTHELLFFSWLLFENLLSLLLPLATGQNHLPSHLWPCIPAHLPQPAVLETQGRAWERLQLSVASEIWVLTHELIQSRFPHSISLSPGACSNTAGPAQGASDPAGLHKARICVSCTFLGQADAQAWGSHFVKNFFF